MWKPPSEGITEALPGGAGARSYERFRSGEKAWIVMILAEEPLRSEEASSGPVSEDVPFLEVQRFLASRGVPVPAVHHHDREAGRIWLDDLGDVRLLDALQDRVPEQWVEAYDPALRALIAFQRGTAEVPDPAPICYQRRFEPALLRWELDHYLEWRVEQQLGRDPSVATRTALASAFDALTKRLARQPEILCHRDFQSTNIMLAPCAGAVLIDFQDALMGPWTYDLVSLLRDSYVRLTPDQVDALLSQYLTMRDDLDANAFRADFFAQTVQRKLKDAGRFVYIDRKKNNPNFLPYVDDSLAFVRHALTRCPDLSDLAGLLAEVDPEAFA